MKTTANRHVPMRRCVVCRASKPQAAQFRLVRDGDAVSLDLTRKLGGRGTWVCHACAASSNEKRLRHAFKGHAQQVALLLSQALAAQPPAGRGATAPAAPNAAPNLSYGGFDV